MDLEVLQNLCLLLIGPLKPRKRLLVVAESQVSVHKGGSWNVACLLTSFQLIKKTKCIGASSSMRIRPDDHTDHGGTAPAESTCLFPGVNHLAPSPVAHQRQTPIPA